MFDLIGFLAKMQQGFPPLWFPHFRPFIVMYYMSHTMNKRKMKIVT